MVERVSAEVLKEIIDAFARKDEIVPSAECLRQLAAVSGQSAQGVKNAFTKAYHDRGGSGDPWEAMPTLIRDELSV
jgi:hypothetical protein